jgi:hypothetical protein
MRIRSARVSVKEQTVAYLALCPGLDLHVFDTTTWADLNPDTHRGCRNARFMPDGSSLLVMGVGANPYGDDYT